MILATLGSRLKILKIHRCSPRTAFTQFSVYFTGQNSTFSFLWSQPERRGHNQREGVTAKEKGSHSERRGHKQREGVTNREKGSQTERRGHNKREGVTIREKGSQPVRRSRNQREDVATREKMSQL
jgi:hypothetical protein